MAVVKCRFYCCQYDGVRGEDCELLIALGEDDFGEALRST
jgi:hypothetical protein